MFVTSKHIYAGDRELQDRAESFWCGSNLVLVVADGAGGMGGGAEVAEFIVSNVRKRIASSDMNSESLKKLLTSLDRDMAAIGAFGEATCVVVVLSDSGVIGVSVGDSGAFVCSEAGLENLTANQVREPFLGSGRATLVSFTRKPLDGTLLIASDGLLRYTSLEKIAATALTADLDVAANKLIALVRYNSGALPDDVSILLARRR